MVERRSGTIVSIGSVVSWVTTPFGGGRRDSAWERGSGSASLGVGVFTVQSLLGDSCGCASHTSLVTLCRLCAKEAGTSSCDFFRSSAAGFDGLGHGHALLTHRPQPLLQAPAVPPIHRPLHALQPHPMPIALPPGSYSASKSALLSMSQALRMELAPFGVQVCYVTAGSIKCVSPLRHCLACVSQLLLLLLLPSHSACTPEPASTATMLLLVPVQSLHNHNLLPSAGPILGRMPVWAWSATPLPPQPTIPLLMPSRLGPRLGRTHAP